MTPEIDTKLLFPGVMGIAIQEMYNVNRDKHRAILITIENHHTTLDYRVHGFIVNRVNVKMYPVMLLMLDVVNPLISRLLNLIQCVRAIFSIVYSMVNRYHLKKWSYSY
jgi:hypothetical protein